MFLSFNYCKAQKINDLVLLISLGILVPLLDASVVAYSTLVGNLSGRVMMDCVEAKLW